MKTKPDERHASNFSFSIPAVELRGVEVVKIDWPGPGPFDASVRFVKVELSPRPTAATSRA